MKSITRQEEQILLVISRLKEEAYLVNIREELKNITGKYLDVGTVYVPLKRLYKKGYLDSYHGKPTAVRGGKAIKYYRLTNRGYEMLSQIKKIQDKLWEGFEFPAIKKA